MNKEELKELRNTKDRNPDLSFLRKGWEEAENKAEYLNEVGHLLNNSIIYPVVAELFVKFLDELDEDEFYDMIDECYYIKPLFEVAEGKRWEELVACEKICARLENDAFSPLDFGRGSQSYFIDYWKSVTNENLRSRALAYLVRCFGGRNNDNQMDTLIKIERGMSSELFELVKQNFRQSWVPDPDGYDYSYRNWKPPKMSIRMKKLLATSGYCSGSRDTAVKAFLEHGLDPLKVDGANKDLVEIAEKFKKLYGKKRVKARE